jgi:hypothetical protein
MKRISALLVLWCVCLGSALLYSTERHVGVGQTYSTIGNAYQAAANGDVIIIHPGNYVEAVPHIQKNLSITGSTTNPADVTIRNSTHNGTALKFGQNVVCSVSYLTLWQSYCGAAVCWATVSFDHCIIEKNTYDGIGSASNSEVTISHCIIRENGWYGVDLDIQQDVRTATLQYNLVYNNGFTPEGYTGAGIAVGRGVISNCTVLFNKKGISTFNTGIPSVTNSIVRNNSLDQVVSSITNITYSNIQGGTGATNIDEDPCFVNPAVDNYHLAWTATTKSPCIDSGDPSILDTDGSPSDMGYCPVQNHKYRQYNFEGLQGIHDGWTWLCFPVVDNLLTNENRIDHVLADLDNLPAPLLDRAQWSPSAYDAFKLLGNTWVNGNHIVTPPQGFKCLANSETSFSTQVSGFSIPATTTFDINGGGVENWLGYFATNTQTPGQAFAGYMNNLTMIKTQNWTMVRTKNTWTLPPNATLHYGDLVIVKATTDIDDFAWASIGETASSSPTPATLFDYVEEADYVPVYVSTEDESAVEVGIYVDGECKGAAVLEDGKAQICAYMLDAEEGADVELVYATGQRAPLQHTSQGYVYDPETGLTTPGNFTVHRGQEYYIFADTREGTPPPPPASVSVSNSPNPFNPSTTVEYSLPADGRATLTIFNLRGQKVRTLFDQQSAAGVHRVEWNGQDDKGIPVASGVYLISLRAGGQTAFVKSLMLK